MFDVYIMGAGILPVTVYKNEIYLQPFRGVKKERNNTR